MGDQYAITVLDEVFRRRYELKITGRISMSSDGSESEVIFLDRAPRIVYFESRPSLMISVITPAAQRKGCTSCQCLQFFLLRALKLCEMSCVVLRLLMEEFLLSRCAESVAVSYQSDAVPDVNVETLDSLLQGRRVRQQKKNANHASTLKSVYSLSTQSGRTVFLVFRARLIDKTAWTHLVAAHKSFLHRTAHHLRAIHNLHP